MKLTATGICAFLVLIAGCSQNTSSALSASRPDTSEAAQNQPPPGADVNTFGESRDPAADEAAKNRAQSYGSDTGSDREANARSSGQPTPR